MNSTSTADSATSQSRHLGTAATRPSFLAAYCAREQIQPSEFTSAVFQRTLMQRKRLAARIARMFSKHFFDDDERLIQVCGTKTTMAEIKQEISEYFADLHYWSVWRKVFDLRISTERLRLTAAQYLEPTE